MERRRPGLEGRHGDVQICRDARSAPALDPRGHDHLAAIGQQHEISDLHVRRGVIEDAEVLAGLVVA
jgi:hypothetical protein